MDIWENDFIFSTNGFGIFFGSERDSDWAPQPQSMCPNFCFLATLSLDVHWELNNQITIESAGANPLQSKGFKLQSSGNPEGCWP